MRVAQIFLLALASMIVVGPTVAQAPRVLAFTAFEAAPPSEADLAERTVGENEPFLLQRLVAISSATLDTEVSATGRFGRATLPVGSRLVLARGAQGGGDYFCGAYEPQGWTGVGMYNRQWMCFSDSNADGEFDQTYSTLPANEGSFLPAFNQLVDPAPIAARYTIDDEASRFAYETAIVYRNSFNIYGRTFFYQVARAAGDEEWRNIASVTRGVAGGYTAVRAPRPGEPQTFELGGAQVVLLTRSDGRVTVDPISAPGGVITFFMGIR